MWLDGRPHPPDMAPHTFSGFSTAAWDGNMLNVYTTHLKESHHLGGVCGFLAAARPRSPSIGSGTGNYLTVITAITDPVFLTEPMVRSQNWVLDLNQRMGRAYLCIRARGARAPRHRACSFSSEPIRFFTKWRIGMDCPLRRRAVEQKRFTPSTS